MESVSLEKRRLQRWAELQAPLADPLVFETQVSEGCGSLVCSVSLEPKEGCGAVKGSGPSRLAFACLEPDVPPTEQALRTPIVKRKASGGNRTPAGCRAYERISSTIQTRRQRDTICAAGAFHCTSAMIRVRATVVTL